jgi:hypothetical protein
MPGQPGRNDEGHPPLRVLFAEVDGDRPDYFTEIDRLPLQRAARQT